MVIFLCFVSFLSDAWEYCSFQCANQGQQARLWLEITNPNDPGQILVTSYASRLL